MLPLVSPTGGFYDHAAAFAVGVPVGHGHTRGALYAKKSLVTESAGACS